MDKKSDKGDITRNYNKTGLHTYRGNYQGLVVNDKVTLKGPGPVCEVS